MRRALRGALAAAVLAGYLVGVAATPAGQGLRLLAHLADAHAAPTLAAPALVADAPTDVLPALSTLRPRAHRHGGGAAHHHGPHAEAPHGGLSLRHRAAPVRVEGPAHGDADGVHEHGGVLHSHTPRPPSRRPS